MDNEGEKAPGENVMEGGEDMDDDFKEKGEPSYFFENSANADAEEEEEELEQ